MDAIRQALNKQTQSARWLWPLGLFLLALAGGWQILSSYFQPGFNQWVCLLVAPMVLQLRTDKGPSLRFGLAGLLVIGLYALTGMKTFFLLGIGFYGFLLLEQFWGRIDWLALVLLLLYLPVIDYLISAFSFPLRLEMSALTGHLLQSIGWPVEVAGNMFYVGKMAFSVDRACMGMKSLSIGLIVLTLLVAFVSQQFQVRFRVWELGLIFLLGLPLLMVGGLLRMLLLVVLTSMPDTLSHELIGLASLLLYMIVPMYFLLRRWGKRKAKQSIIAEESAPLSFPLITSPKTVLILLLPVLSIFLVSWSREEIEKPIEDAWVAQLELPGMQKTVRETGVVQFENDSVLLYVKPAVRFWGADHTPEVCWRASGYTFSHIDTLSIGGQTIWQAKLIHESETLYTAWWYENSQSRTHQQWEWRWQMLKGAEPYRLINVTTVDPDELTVQCQGFTGGEQNYSLFRTTSAQPLP